MNVWNYFQNFHNSWKWAPQHRDLEKKAKFVFVIVEH